MSLPGMNVMLIGDVGTVRDRNTNRREHPREYSSWLNMKSRCDNISVPKYKDYGGRGITYDKKWADFKAFFADMGERPPKTTLDRVDNNGPYNKDNCRWATPSQQERNKRFKRRPQ